MHANSVSKQLVWNYFTQTQTIFQIARVGVSPNISLKLFGREIIFEVFQPK